MAKIYQPKALNVMFTLMRNSVRLDPVKYTKGQSAVVNTIFNYLDAVIDGAKPNDLCLVGQGTVLEVGLGVNSIKLRLTVNGKVMEHQINHVGRIDFKSKGAVLSDSELFTMRLKALVGAMDFEGAIDAHAQHIAQSVKRKSSFKAKTVG